jgi:hypothetical protein
MLLISYSLADMNWTCLVYGGPMLLITIWWFVSAHKWFKGPKINIDHQMLGRGEVLVGEGPSDDKRDRDDSSAEAQRLEKHISR